MTYEERVKVYNQALTTFGIIIQLTVAIEELSECQKEICKALRGNASASHLAEEVADATIMLEQVQWIFGINAMVDKAMDQKIERLQGRILAAKPPMDWDEKTESGLLEEDLDL